MEDKDLAIECVTATLERVNKRLFILCLVMFIACVLTNFGWIYYESQYEKVTETEIMQENESGNYRGD